MLALSAIRTDGGTQPRAAIDFGEVAKYAEDIAVRGCVFPPAVVFYDGTDYWLADGFHRLHAHKAAGRTEIDCDVRQGTRRDAVLFSVGANAAHGISRSNEDKRRAVLTLLNDAEWVAWSDHEIARRCAVSQPFVGKLRPVVTNNVISETRAFVNKHGSVSTMRTGAIGGASSRPAFDSSGAGARIAAERPMPEVERLESIGAPPERAQQLAHDNAHGWISSALWEIERQIEALPTDPRLAARLFPAGHRHTLPARRARALVDWMTAFADEWAKIEQENMNVAAE